MGETADLQSVLAGQFSLNDWLGQQDGAATPKGLIPFILPVQEMRPFQRRYRFDEGTQALDAGERISLLRWTVPQREWWKPLAVLYQNADSATHGVLTSFSMAKSAASLVYQPTRTRIRANATKIVYGSVWDGTQADADETMYSSDLHVTMEPGDDFDLIDLTANTGASQQRWIFVYELVPQPPTPRTRGVAGEVTVV